MVKAYSKTGAGRSDPAGAGARASIQRRDLRGRFPMHTPGKLKLRYIRRYPASAQSGRPKRHRLIHTLGGTGSDVDTLYAITLMVAIAAGVIAILTSLLGLVKTDTHLEPGASVWKLLCSHRLGAGALALGVFSLTISVLVHSRWGHGPGTVAPMNLSQLLSEHEAFPVVALILFLALALALYRNRRQRWRDSQFEAAAGRRMKAD